MWTDVKTNCKNQSLSSTKSISFDDSMDDALQEKDELIEVCPYLFNNRLSNYCLSNDILKFYQFMVYHPEVLSREKLDPFIDLSQNSMSEKWTFHKIDS